jgi:cell division protein FtsN
MQTPDSPLLLNESIQDELIKIDEAGGRCVLIIDEAQLMSDDLFQEVLFFTNLETSRHKLIQIFLLGQKELLDKLNRPEMRQLSQRISVTKFLRSMDRTQSIQYIKHRLKIAGGSPEIFSEEALDLIVSNSGGIPRIVNRLCDATLLKAFILKKETVEATEVQTAISDLGLDLRSMPQGPVRRNLYRRRVLQPQEDAVRPAHQAVRIALGDDKKSSQKEEEKTTQSGRGHRSKGLKLALILAVIVFLVAGIIRQLGMNGSERIETDKSPSYVKEEIFKGIAKKEPNAAPLQAINDKSLGQSVVEKKSIDSIPSYPKNAEYESKAPEQTGSVTKKVRLLFPYSVLLASYRTLKTAERGLAIYREKGLSPYWVRVDLGDNNVWYRVFTGHFKGREQAEAFIKENRLVEARSKKIKYANLVGVYTSENALNAKLLELSTLGYCPYQGAETQRSELIANGIQCQVVEQ